MSKITTPDDSTRVWNDAIADAAEEEAKALGIEGKRNPVTGRFEVTKWPEPRVSNPNFLSEELARFYKCTICGVNSVDAENGFDTCQDCLDAR